MLLTVSNRYFGIQWHTQTRAYLFFSHPKKSGDGQKWILAQQIKNVKVNIMLSPHGLKISLHFHSAQFLESRLEEERKGNVSHIHIPDVK